MSTEEPPADTKTRWFGLVAAASGTYLAALDITVNVALPNITESFGTDPVTIQWIIIFYVGGSTAMQLGLGGAADVFGLKRMFLVGLAAYTVAVAAIGFAESLGLVFGLRVFQAVGNGLIIALGPAIVTRLFPSDFRGRALGIMAGLGTLGLITGSLGGGLMVDAFGWRSIFLGRLPLCLMAIGFSALFLRFPEVGPERASAGGFDFWGSGALTVAVGSLVLMLTLGGRNGWTEPYVPALAIVAAGAFVAFVAIERRVERPVLELSLLRRRTLSTGLALSMLAFLSTFVNWFILPFFVIDALGASASTWGILLMLMTITNALGSPAGGWLSDRANPAYTMTAALTISTLAMLALSRLDSGSSVVTVGFGLIAVGLGMGLFQSSNANLIMGSVPADRLGMGGGVLGLARGLGTVLSVAVMGAVFASRETSQGSDAPGNAAFILAYQDTYLVVVALAALAAALSLTLWRRDED